MIWVAAIWIVSFIMLYLDAWNSVRPMRKDLEIGHLLMLYWTIFGPVIRWVTFCMLGLSFCFGPLFLVLQVLVTKKDGPASFFAAAIVFRDLDYQTAVERAGKHGIDREHVDEAIEAVRTLYINS